MVHFQKCVKKKQSQQGRLCPYAEAFLCHPSLGGRGEPQAYPGVPRPQVSKHYFHIHSSNSQDQRCGLPVYQRTHGRSLTNREVSCRNWRTSFAAMACNIVPASQIACRLPTSRPWRTSRTAAPSQWAVTYIFAIGAGRLDTVITPAKTATVLNVETTQPICGSKPRWACCYRKTTSS